MESNGFKKGGNYAVALSGGVDSTVLLHLFLRWGCKVTAVHVNHGLRGENSNRDERFCIDLCRSLDVSLLVESVDVVRIARENRKGIEEAARNGRYDVFDKCHGSSGCFVATAHNQNDQAETVLQSLLRGCDLKGLGGIPPVRGYIIRPLLSVPRQEIENYAAHKGIRFVTDETNLSNKFTRNKIRMNILPLLTDINPQAVAHISDAAASARRDAEYLDALAAVKARDVLSFEHAAVRINLPLLSQISDPISSRIIKIALDAMKVSVSREAIHNLLVGAAYDMKGGVAYRQGESLIIAKQKPEQCTYCYSIFPGQTVFIRELGCSVALGTEKFGNRVLVNGHEGLIIRSRRPGDRIRFTFGSKKVKDYLIDRKIPKLDRDKYPILEQNGRIVAILGLRSAVGEGDELWASIRY